MYQGAALWLTHTLIHSVVFQVVICWRRLLLLLLLLLLQFRQINTGVRFTSTWTAFNYKCISVYTGCPRRNVKYFRRVFLMLNYTDITQNTFIQSWTVTEIMAREKCVLLAGPRTVRVSWQLYPCPSLNVVSYYGNSAQARSKLLIYFLLGDKVGHVSAWHSCHV